jgi:hypothetical protein
LQSQLIDLALMNQLGVNVFKLGINFVISSLSRHQNVIYNRVTRSFGNFPLVSFGLRLLHERTDRSIGIDAVS